MSLSHSELCEIGRRWLLRSLSSKGPGCRIALAEPPIGLHGGEIPDAIGWRTADALPSTYMVEAKTSRSDFHADAGKMHRNSLAGVGNYRFYLCPEGVIQPDDLPEKWGLLWVNGNGRMKHIVSPFATARWGDVSKALTPMRFENVNQRHETSILANALARVGDPQAVLAEVRESQRRANWLAKQCDQQRADIRELSSRLFMAKFGEGEA